MQVRIYRAGKSAMQSGRASGKPLWRLDGEPATPRLPEPLNGWPAAGDTHPQIRLRFPSCEAAVRHAERQGWTYEVALPNDRLVTPRTYADSFKTKTASSV